MHAAWQAAEGPGMQGAGWSGNQVKLKGKLAGASMSWLPPAPATPPHLERQLKLLVSQAPARARRRRRRRHGHACRRGGHRRAAGQQGGNCWVGRQQQELSNKQPGLHLRY